MFEANPLNSCAPIYGQNKSHSIVFGVKDDDSTPYATFYTESGMLTFNPCVYYLDTIFFFETIPVFYSYFVELYAF